MGDGEGYGHGSMRMKVEFEGAAMRQPEERGRQKKKFQ